MKEVLNVFRKTVARSFWVAALIAVVCAGAAVAMDVEQAADKVYLAAVEGTPFPVLSAEYADMTEAGSYAVQKAYSLKRLEGKRPAGFKAGLTTEATMKRFGASTPFAAPLFPEGAMDGSAESVVVDRASFGVLMLEAEIAFILGEPVDASLKDEAELKAKIESVAAAVELPDLSFTDMKLLKAMDINASAISSKAWILGKRIPLADAPDLNELVPVMTLDGVEATRGKGADALGDQWKALLWLVNKMVEEGWTMEKGDVLLTGALGNMIPGKPGEYVYSIEPLGTVKFTVK